MGNENTSLSFRLSTPFGDDILSVDSFEGYEEISSGFKYTLELSSLETSLAFTDIIGEPVSLTISRPHEHGAQINGIATHFAQVSTATDMSHYQLVIEPWMAILHHRNNCRIFQNKTVLEILQEVFEDAGFSGLFVDETSGSQTKWEYTVQYRESDFNFVHRLMAECGIFYYYSFEGDQHKLILSNDQMKFPKIDGEMLAYLRAHKGTNSDEGISIFEEKQQIRPTAATLKDFNFQKPSAQNMEVSSENGAELEIYDYPGRYLTKEEGDVLVKHKLESIQFDTTVYQGQTNSRRLICGHTFELIDHMVDGLNINYLLVKVARRGVQSGDEATFSNQFEVIDAEVPFRPINKYHRPSVAGIQTAIVVGPKDEEIWLDKYGRVKVQFHWDRVGESNANSSCWVRVAQGIAGTNWGTVFHPRIGQEVIVQFIEGDLDRPVVTGSLYNEEHMPPYELPANASQSVIKTRSTPGGGADNFNEIRFEDKKDEEHLLIHAEKDFILETENDETHTVGNNRSVTVEVDETHEVKGNRSHTVTGDETNTISANRIETVEADETITIKGKRTETVTGDEAITLDSTRKLTIAKDDTVEVGANHTITIAKNETIDVGKVVTIDAGDEITLKCGMASFTMKKDGTVEISGKDITISGMGKFTAEGTLGSEVTGLTVDVSAQTMVNVKGAMVNLN